jgi:hypothetical protein
MLSMMPLYNPLNVARKEVRMLRIVESEDGNPSDIVHCELDVVSLLDLTSIYKSFVSTKDPWNDSTIRQWLEFGCYLEEEKGRQIRLPLWRRDGDIAGCEEPFESSVSSSFEPRGYIHGLNHYRFEGLNSFRKASVSQSSQTRLRTTLMGESKSLADFSLVPRFQWGDFEAMSYCWESDIRERKIVLNNALFDVPKNLEVMLQRLRALPDSKVGMRFWIDALCINQGDIEEKNNQVRLMQEIYLSAFAVIVWLGDTAEGSDDAVEFILSVTEYGLGKENVEAGYVRSIPLKGRKLQVLNRHLPWKELFSLFTRNYWRRLWIIQELALNHNMTLFMCGDRHISRSMIQRICSFCSEYIDPLDQLILESDMLKTDFPGFINGSTWDALTQVQTLVHLSSHNTSNGAQSRALLDRVLDLARRANVTQPCDKIYGLLGILIDTISGCIIPDYTLSQRQVYTQFAKVLFKSDKLDVGLSWCSFNRDSTVPSWVPDWTKPFPRHHVRWLRMRKTSGNMVGAWQISDDDLRLSSPGFIADEIRTISSSVAESIPYSCQLSKGPTSKIIFHYSLLLFDSS